MEIEKRDFTLAEAATELDVNSKGLSRFAKHFGIGNTPRKDVHSLDQALTVKTEVEGGGKRLVLCPENQAGAR